MAKVKQICEETFRPVIEAMGYELVEVSFVKENGGMSLIFTIDKESGVTIDDCELVNKKIDESIDELDPTEGKPYTLVVSSPGIDRPLKSDRDFNRNLGKEVDLTLFSKLDGKKKFTGILKSFDEKNITIEEKTGTMTFEREKVACVTLVIKF